MEEGASLSSSTTTSPFSRIRYALRYNITNPHKIALGTVAVLGFLMVLSNLTGSYRDVSPSFDAIKVPKQKQAQTHVEAPKHVETPKHVEAPKHVAAKQTPATPKKSSAKAAKSVPAKGPSPTAAPECLQWLAGSCISWNGPPPDWAPGGPGAPAPAPAGKGGKAPPPEANPYATPPPTPKPVYRAPCNSSACCRHFFPGNKDVGLGSMYDPRCVLDLPPHPNCIGFFMCSYCCNKPLNGACPMKSRTCDSLDAKKIKEILSDAQKKEEEEEKEEAEKKKKHAEQELKKKREAAAAKLKKSNQKGHHSKATEPPTPFPTPEPTIPKDNKAPCKTNSCCNYFWPGSKFNKMCEPGQEGHLGCVAGFSCIYHYDSAGNQKVQKNEEAEGLGRILHIHKEEGQEYPDFSKSFTQGGYTQEERQ